MSSFDLSISWVSSLGSGLVSKLLVAGSTLVKGLSSIAALDSRVEIVARGTGELGGHNSREGCWTRRDGVRVINFLLGKVVHLHHGERISEAGNTVVQVLSVELILHELELRVGQSLDEGDKEEIVNLDETFAFLVEERVPDTTVAPPRECIRDSA